MEDKDPFIPYRQYLGCEWFGDTKNLSIVIILLEWVGVSTRKVKYLEHIFSHDDAIKWKNFRATGHFAGNSPVPGEFPVQRPVTRSFDVFFDLFWISGWVNNREAGDLRRYRAYYGAIVMWIIVSPIFLITAYDHVVFPNWTILLTKYE